MNCRMLLPATLVVAPALGAQTTPATVVAKPTTIFSYPVQEENAFPHDIAGAPGATLLYYVTGDAVRVYNRVTKSVLDVVKGSYDYVATSTQGDRLVLLRPAEGAKTGAPHQAFVWTLPVNSATGVANGEPRRVSLLPGESPRFSPDGQQIAFIATGNPRKMMVIPSAGGPERVLFERGGPRGPVQWSPDGKWIYFAQPSGQRDAPIIVSRVSVDGGTPSPMTPPVQDAGLGLSPDGRSIVTIRREAGAAFTLGVFDTSKTLVRSINVPVLANGEPLGFAWAGNGMHVIGALADAAGSARSFSTSDAGDHVLPFKEGVRKPTLSPDGKHFAYAGLGDTTLWQVVLMEADGSGRRSVRAISSMVDLDEAQWSPDGNYLSFPGDAFHSVYVANATTGKAIKVGTGSLHAAMTAWRADSRALLYVRQEGTNTRTQVSVRESTVDGNDRLVRDITSEIPQQGEPWYGATWVVNDSQALVIRLGLVVSLNGGPTRKLYEPMKISTAWDGSAPAMSADGRWIALPAIDRKSIDIITMDGKSRQTIRLPEGAPLKSLLWRQPSKGPLVVVTSGSANRPWIIYGLPIDGGAPRALVTLPIGQYFNDVTISRDEKTIVHTSFSQPTMTFVDVDLGVAPPAARKP